MTNISHIIHKLCRLNMNTKNSTTKSLASDADSRAIWESGKAPGHMSGQVPTTGGEEEPPTSSSVLLGATKVGLLPWSGAGWPTPLGFGSADHSRQPPGRPPATKAAGGERRGEEDGGSAGRCLPRPLIFSLPFAKNRGWCKMSKK